MNLSKPVNPIRDYAFGSVIAALILLSPVFAFLVVIAAEMLIDSLMAGGTSAVCAIAAGGIGLDKSGQIVDNSARGFGHEERSPKRRSAEPVSVEPRHRRP